MVQEAGGKGGEGGGEEVVLLQLHCHDRNETLMCLQVCCNEWEAGKGSFTVDEMALCEIV